MAAAPINYSIKDVDKVIKKINGGIKKVDITRLTLPGENYISLVFQVDIHVLEKDGATKVISTIAKRLPLESKIMVMNAIGMRNEINWYSQVLPQFKEAEKEFGIDNGDDYYPEYLGGRFSLDPLQTTTADSESVLFLRNLIPEGYHNEDRHVGFDLATAKAIIKGLAKFHSIPLILKFKKPDQFESLKALATKTLSDIPKPPEVDSTEDGPKFPDQQKVFDKMLEIPACQPYKAKVEALKLKMKAPPDWSKAGLEPWNTFVHNDFWVNNIMVKFRREEGQEPLVKLVDFQFFSYASYVKDLVFFLLSSVRNDVLKPCLDDLLRHYYDELTSLLQKVSIPELKLSYEDYLEEVKRVALESEVGHAIFFSTVIFAAKGEAPDFLTGDGDAFAHLEYLNNNINDAQQDKLVVVAEVCAARGWI